MNSRRSFCYKSATASILLLSGCVTGGMHYNKYIDYTEDVRQVLATSDMSKVVVVGAKSHYIFNAPEGLLDALASKAHPAMDADFSDFYIDSENRVQGSFRLIIRSVAPEAVALSSRFGFKQVGYSFEKVMALDGVRFDSSTSIASDLHSLNRRYTVRVREPEGISRKILKVAATPVTVVADGALVLFGLPLVPFFCSSQGACK